MRFFLSPVLVTAITHKLHSPGLRHRSFPHLSQACATAKFVNGTLVLVEVHCEDILEVTLKSQVRVRARIVPSLYAGALLCVSGPCVLWGCCVRFLCLVDSYVRDSCVC